jgi:catechol 2,3-dioxygenase-like lactoylglutathione lyase family enzyme
VQLRVSDVAASVDWYCRALGLVAPESGAISGAVPLFTANGRFAVVISPGFTGGAHLDHLAFAVADRPALDRWADELAAAGIPHDGVTETPVGFELHLRDPDGLDVELLVAH